jgi:RND family efflux transporter MFP subunit
MVSSRWSAVFAALVISGFGMAPLGQPGARPDELQTDTPSKAPRRSEPAVFEVTPGKFEITVIEHGTLEPYRTDMFVDSVEGMTKIASIVPEGTKVEKGQLVCELDSSALQEKLADQEAATAAAEAAYQTARLARERAEQAKAADLEQTRSDEDDKKSALEKEKWRESRRRAEVRSCKFFAPRDGVVVYANPVHPVIFLGATVRQGQVIVKIPDLREIVVNTKVHEISVDRVKRRQRARVKVDGLATQTLTGVVEQVNPLPDPRFAFEADVKRSTTLIKIDNGPVGLEPGMTAECEIVVAELEGALSVPLSAVHHSGGKARVAVRKADGSFEWRDVSLGESNSTFVQLTFGVKAEDVVALDARALATKTK